MIFAVIFSTRFRFSSEVGREKTFYKEEIFYYNPSARRPLFIILI